MKIKKGDKVLVLSAGRQKIVIAGAGVFHSDLGILDLKKIVGKNFGAVVETTASRKVILAKPSFYDLLACCKRGPAVILPKDFASIVALTGIGRDSVCVDVGAGSGWLSAQLANVCKKVTAYEVRKDFSELARKNFKFLGLKNIILKNKNAIEKIDEMDTDLITTDFSEPWQALKSAAAALRVGGYFVAYCPQITQVQEFVSKLGEGWQLEKVVETLQREWKVVDRVCRPEHQILGHTAFIVVVRKIL